MLNKNKIPLYKYKQLKLFFRFLKEYKYYKIYINNLNKRIEYDLENRYCVFEYNGIFYEKNFINLINYYLYLVNPTSFFDFFLISDKNKDYHLIRALWLHHIIDLFNSKKDFGAFDERDIILCKKMLYG